MKHFLVRAAGIIFISTDAFSSFQIMDAAGEGNKEHDDKGEKRGRSSGKVEVN